MNTKLINPRRELSSRTMTRQGAALYTLVLLTSILVSAIGLAALQLARTRGRELSDDHDFRAAQAAAYSALQLAQPALAGTSNWRSQLVGSSLVQNQSFGRGSLAVSVTDPADGVISDYDKSVLVVGTGQQGRAVQKLSLLMESRAHERACLRHAMAAGSGIVASQSTLRSLTSISPGGDLQTSSSLIAADVVVSGSASPAGITGTVTQHAQARLMPDAQHVLDYYLQNGTAISYSSLPRWQQSQIIRNNSFESDTSAWYALTDCNLNRSSSRSTIGTWSLRVSSRSSRDDSAAQDLTLGSIKNGNTYRVSIPFYPTATGTASAHITLQSSGEGIQVLQLPNFACSKNSFGNFSWITIEGDLTLRWSGTLTKATLSLDSSFSQDFYLDAVSLVDVTYPNNTAVIDRQLISPANNPLGATNAQGIYVINCGNQDLVVGRTRLVGTLVLVNPGPGSRLANWVNMEPAVSGMPCLLVDGNMRLDNDGEGFSEAAVGINLNPAGTPYPYPGGLANSALTDNYPALFSGLIYTTGSLTFAGASRIHGLALAGQSIQLTSANVVLEFDDQYQTNPPPGFQSGITVLRPRPGSIKRVVN